MLNSDKKLVLQNAVPEDMALAVRQAFLDADYDKIRQERKTQFFREKLTFSPKYPNKDEVYSAEFCRSSYLEKSALIKLVYNDYIKPIVVDQTEFEPNNVELRAYKMIAGGHFRVHKDDWMARVGFVWYLSKEWKWDWGGLLVDLDINDDSRAQVTIPTFNQLVIMDHKNHLPHLVTPVAEWALEPRFMLVGFLS